MLEQVRYILTAAIDWFRAGYPAEAPRTGYSPLVALNGPVALTTGQKHLIATNLEGQPTDTISVEVAITRATNRLPSPAQTHTIIFALHPRTPSR